ncbi:MAG: DUF2309 domain-containing protein [Candidatus Sedimenticola sp. (ex Thyasira tokunagai)]
MSEATAAVTDIRQTLRDAIAHFEHVLPGQAPIRDFVHHNTLHGYQHLHFAEALQAAEKLTGAKGFLPQERFRKLFREGRITRQDLEQVLDQEPDLDAAKLVTETAQGGITRRDLFLAALSAPIKKISTCQFKWQLEEMDALTSFQGDVPERARQSLLAAAAHQGQGSEEGAIADLWAACLESLGLEEFALHPEQMIDLTPERAEAMLQSLVKEEGDSVGVQQVISREVNQQLDALLAQVGEEITLRGLLLKLTGEDLLEQIRPTLLRHMASHLDQGLASWHGETRELGFYHNWRRAAADDLAWLVDDLPDWGDNLEFLPDDSVDAVIAEMHLLGLPQNRWVSYLEQLSLELPGWSGMFLWRHLHPGYEGEKPQVDMMDYLAVRLVLERIYARRLARNQWQIEPSLDGIRWHFRHHRSEFLVRYALFSAHLPEYLINMAERLMDLPTQVRLTEDDRWERAAQLIWTWQQGPTADHIDGCTVYDGAWRLFRLSQHLGLCGDSLRKLSEEQRDALFDSLLLLTEERAGMVWLQAYENHYLDQLLNALTDGYGRDCSGEEATSAQLVFCMDDREEGFRRHLEEIDPSVETFGAAAHFAVPHLSRAYGSEKVTALCPVGVVPLQEVREQVLPEQQAAGDRRLERAADRTRFIDVVHQESRRNLFSTLPLMAAAAPAALFTLIGKVFAPLGFARLVERLRINYEGKVDTGIEFCAEEGGEVPSPEQPQQGFTDDEQLNRVETLLRNIGLVDGFAPLVVIMAHGSSSQNNPHLAAYDCGACSGRHSGPNARLVCAMANRPEIRARLAEQGINIPSDTWFLAGEHNTCTEGIEWYDLNLLPEVLSGNLKRLRQALVETSERHARERCRRLASAPDAPTNAQALKHIVSRAYDFSQARPELGHATNAAAFIGRRTMSRGTFYDRRVFLISYDYTTDPTGEVLERLLLANGPVGAGISLEYYFSTVDNDNYGCGSKITHNITGMFGVMDGAGSDLRTGLPKQMIEIHEAMRLQIVVEASIEMLTKIYTRQPPLQELIGNGWLLVSAMDPETGEITLFKPDQGFVPWTGRVEPLPRVGSSIEWYNGYSEPLTPARIETEAAHG